MLIQTTFKNGYSFVTDCEKYGMKKDNSTGNIVSIQWVGCKTGKPIYVDVNEIVAIVRLDDCMCMDEKQQ